MADLDALIGQLRAAGLDMTLEILGKPADLPAGAQLAMFRLVQKSLANTLKHAGAASVPAWRLVFATIALGERSVLSVISSH